MPWKNFHSKAFCCLQPAQVCYLDLVMNHQFSPLTKEAQIELGFTILSETLNACPPGRYHIVSLLPRIIQCEFETASAWYQLESPLARRKIEYDEVSGWFTKHH